APVAMYRRTAIDKVGGYDPSIKVQDFQMTLRVAEAGYQVDILPDRVTLYRRHATNISKTAYKSQLIYDLKVIEAYKDNPAYEAGRLAIINKALKESVVADKKFASALCPADPHDEVLQLAAHGVCLPARLLSGGALFLRVSPYGSQPAGALALSVAVFLVTDFVVLE
nr:hypothetical protein [Tanacetum cinerariifolium]